MGSGMRRYESLLFKLFYFLLSATILYFIVAPVVSVFVYGLTSADGVGLSEQILPRVWRHMKNSLLVGGTVTLLATAFGLFASLALWRLRFVGRGLMRILVLMPLISPPFVGSVAFIMLFGKRGLITHTLLGFEVSPYGFYGIVTMQTIGLATLAYLVISSAIQKTDVTHEDAARSLGASEAQIFRTITLPLMVPEITVAAMLVFLASLSDFSTPIIIGGGFQTLASDLYIQINGLYNMRTAAISGMFLLLPCAAAFFIQRYYSGRNPVYSQAVSADVIEYQRVSRGVKTVLIFITSLFILFVLLQYAFIIIGAFTERWGYDYSFTLRHFQTIITKESAPFINTVKLAIPVGIISSLLGVLLAYIIKSKQYVMSRQIDFLATLPAAIPGILLGIGYLVTFRYPLLGAGRFYLTDLDPIILLGTGIIIYLICIYRYLYVGMKAGYALMEHLNPNLEIAAMNLGAGERRIFIDIIFPLLKPAFSAAFLKNFTSSMTTLGAIIFLLLPKNKVAVQQIFTIMTSSEIGAAAMMALMLSLLSLVLLALFQLLLNFKALAEYIQEVRQWGSNSRQSTKHTGG